MELFRYPRTKTKKKREELARKKKERKRKWWSKLLRSGFFVQEAPRIYQ